MDLEEMRQKIDEIDSELLKLLLERMEVSKDVARYKLERGMPIFQPDREKSVLDSRCAAVEDTMSPYVREFFQNVMDISKRLQQNLSGQQ